MPFAALKPCRHPSCPKLTANGYCEQHLGAKKRQREYFDKQRGSAASRGYGRSWREGARLHILARDPVCRECVSRATAGRQPRKIPRSPHMGGRGSLFVSDDRT